MTTATVTGTSGEDRSDYTSEESRQIRRRSLRLLGSLVGPLRWQLVLAATVLVVSTILRVAGPALIAYGINTALPAVAEEGDWMPAIMVVSIYLTVGARRVGPHRLVRRGGRAPHAGGHARSPQAHLPAHAEAEPGVPRVVHVGAHHLAADERPRLDQGTAGRRAQRAGVGHPLRRVHPHRAAADRLAVGRHPPRGRSAARSADAVVLHALAGRLPAVAGRQREGHRSLRRDHDGHPRGQGLPQGAAQRRGVRKAGG